MSEAKREPVDRLGLGLAEVNRAVGELQLQDGADEPLQQALAHLHELHNEVRVALGEAVRRAESAEARRKVAWARTFSARRATIWMISTIYQQLRYGRWRPAEVVEFLADLAALWEPEADDQEYRRVHAPAAWLTPLPRLGLDLLRRFDQWEAVDIAAAVLPFAKARSAVRLDRVTMARFTEDALIGVDQEVFDDHSSNMLAALEQVIAALQHGMPDDFDPSADD